MSSISKLFKSPFVNEAQADKASEEYIEKIRTKTPSTHTKVGSLSGGNQQKVVISKWLLRDCDILIFDEPTRGIDVGAKSEIYKLMNQLAAQGKSIIMISEELPELIGMSDRILIMKDGQVTKEFTRDKDLTQEQIIEYMI